MEFVDVDGVPIAFQVTGDGEPATCFVPGLTQTISDVRPFGSGVAGTKAFLDVRGHGASGAPAAGDRSAWTYAGLADDVHAVAETVGARQAVGVSLGAGSLLACIAREPSRWDRLVLALPSALDEPRTSPLTAVTDALADAIDARDLIAIGDLLLQLQPPSIRRKPAVTLWVRRHASGIAGTALSRALRTLPRQVPVARAVDLATFEGQVLVLAQTNDPAHPVSIAERVAASFRHAKLIVSDDPWIWSARTQLRDVVSGFLNA